MRKLMIHGKEVWEKQVAGAKAVYEAVGSSYSPRGRLTSIGRPWGFPIIIADGVSIAKEVGSTDIFTDQAIMTIVEAAKKQVEEAGDGTTVTTILAYHIVEKGTELLKKGHNPAVIRMQMKKALPKVLEKLKEMATPIKGTEDIRNVARISSTDDEIAAVVTEAVEKIGKDGQITVEERKDNVPVMEVSYNDGMQVEKGWATPYFVTDVDRMEAVYDNVAVVVINKRITTQLEIMPLLEVVMQKSKNILIVGEVEGEALRVCVVNKMKNVLNILTVPPPASGEKRKEMLEDIATVTGAKIVVDELGLPKEQFYAQFDKEWIGSAKTVVSRKDSTLIVRVEEKDVETPEEKKKIQQRNKAIAERIEQVRKKKEEAKVIYDREKYEERLAKLTTGVGVIRVSAKAGVDTRERLERVKDAVAAAKACQEEGIVPGGGMIFTQIAKALEFDPKNPSKRTNNLGEQLLYDILQEPTQKIMSNAGLDAEEMKIVMEGVAKKGGNYGYNVETEQIEDMVKTGVIDPAKVIRCAIENAVAVGTTMLLTNTLIADAPEENKNMQIV